MQQAYPEILALGAEVYFIGPEVRDNAMKLMDKHHASIPILYDLNGSVMEGYGLAFTLPDYLQPIYKQLGFPDLNPATGWKLPIPATFIVDGQGIIRGRHVNADYTRRMEPVDIIRVLRKIAGQPYDAQAS